MSGKILYFLNGKEIDDSLFMGGWLKGEEPKIGDSVLKVRVRKPIFGEFYLRQSEIFVDKLHSGNWDKHNFNPCYFKNTGIITPIKKGKYGQIYSIPLEEFIQLYF